MKEEGGCIKWALVGITGFLTTILGGVFLAWLIYDGGRFQPSITVENKLLLPVEIYVDESPQGIIQPRSSKTIATNNNPVSVRWKIITKQDVYGNPIGQQISGNIQEVYRDQSVKITNTIDGVTYFYPIITNKTKNEYCYAKVYHSFASTVSARPLLDENEPTPTPLPTPTPEPQMKIEPSRVDVEIGGYFELTSIARVWINCGSVEHNWNMEYETNRVDPGSGGIKFVYPP